MSKPKARIDKSHKIVIMSTGDIFENNQEKLSVSDDYGGNRSEYLKAVKAEIPDQVQLSLEPNWDTPITAEAGQELKAAVQGIQDKLNEAFDSDIDVVKYLNLQKSSVWAYMGQSPLQLSLQIKFRVYDSLEKDIVKPVKRLIRMASPAGVGKTIGDNIGFVSKPDPVDVRIGNIIYLQDALIMNVSPSIEKPFLADNKYSGIPSIVECSVTFSTKYGAVWGTDVEGVPDVRDLLFFK